jgi:diaminopimelate decarboxylase
MNVLKDEALWITKEILSQLDTDDTAVLFQSWNQLDRYLIHLREAFSGYNALHAIAIKTNPHPDVLRFIVSKGFGLEAASMEEVELGIKAGIKPDKLVFDSPVKTRAEIRECHERFPGIHLNANSLDELKRMPVSPNFNLGIRINPMVETGAPELYHVSHDESKFGEPISNREAIIRACLNYSITQLHIHSGSALENLEIAVKAIASIVELAKEINSQLAANDKVHRIKRIDIGGGLKPELLSQHSSQMNSYTSLLTQLVPDLAEFQVITEFGQWCHFYCGYALSKVEYVLKRGNKQVAFVHLGADFLMRDAYVKPRGLGLVSMDSKGNQLVDHFLPTDIAGPLCFAGDYLVKNVQLPVLEEDNLMLLLGTGSNAFGLWSRHCSRAIPKVIGVDYTHKQFSTLSERTNFT